MPRFKAGGFDSSSLVSLSLDDTVAYQGSGSLKVVTGYPTYAMSASDLTGLPPVSIHRNFLLWDNFERIESILASRWDATFSGFYYSSWWGADLSEYNLMSFFAKGSGSFNVGVFLEDSNNNVTTTFSSAKFENYWKRIDIPITWCYCDPTDVDFIAFTVRGENNTPLWIDEVVFLDRRTASVKENWIDLNATQYRGFEDSGIVVSEIAGQFGDVVKTTEMRDASGEVTFYTHAVDDDEDLEFIERLARNGVRSYLRMGNEGGPVFVTDISAKATDAYRGVNREMKMKHREGELGGDYDPQDYS